MRLLVNPSSIRLMTVRTDLTKSERSGSAARRSTRRSEPPRAHASEALLRRLGVRMRGGEAQIRPNGQPVGG
jgi:hypothetical protein